MLSNACAYATKHYLNGSYKKAAMIFVMSNSKSIAKEEKFGQILVYASVKSLSYTLLMAPDVDEQTYQCIFTNGNLAVVDIA